MDWEWEKVRWIDRYQLSMGGQSHMAWRVILVSPFEPMFDTFNSPQILDWRLEQVLLLWACEQVLLLWACDLKGACWSSYIVIKIFRNDVNGSPPKFVPFPTTTLTHYLRYWLEIKTFYGIVPTGWPGSSTYVACPRGLGHLRSALSVGTWKEVNKWAPSQPFAL